MRRRLGLAWCGVLAGVLGVLGGCLDRRLVITSEPPGAVVTVNDVEVGRTPVEARFSYYGTYEVLLELEGYEPKRERALARAPLHEYPPLDLIATAAPVRIERVVKWHFVLEPAMEASRTPAEIEAAVAERARGLRGRLEPGQP
jgi:hypothetical protein